MTNEKKHVYKAPYAELIFTSEIDVISTSGFDGGDHVIGTPKSEGEGDGAYEI